MISIKKIYLIIFVLILVILGTVPAASELPQLEEKDGVLRAGEGWLVETKGLKVAYFTGSPQEIGIQHGLLLAAGDDELLELFESLDPSKQAEGLLERIGWFFRNLYARYRLYPAFKRHTPDEYLQEMEGFILGASKGETSNYYDIMMGNAAQDLAIAGPSCSAFAAWGDAVIDGSLYVGRNLDHAGYIDLAGYQYVGVYVPESGNRFVVHNYPSFIGTMSGMNEKGIVITSNYSIARQNEVTFDGLPYMLMLRQVLQYAGTLQEALDMIREAPRTIGLNLMLADAGSKEAAVVELTANRMVVRHSDDFICSTNMFKDSYMQQFQAPGWMSSDLRDRRFNELKEQYWGNIDVEISREFLRDKLSGPAREGFYAGINTEVNLASMVLVPDRGELWVGLVSKDGIAPYAADGSYVGIDAAAIWESGQPQEVIGVLPATEREGREKYWFMVRDTARLIDLNQNEQALDKIEQVLDIYPEAAVPQLFAGRLHNRLHNYEQAIHFFEKFIAQKTHPEPYNLIQAYFWAGLAKDQLGVREKAVDYYQKALKVEIADMPGGLDSLLNLARAGIDNKLIVENGVVRPE